MREKWIFLANLKYLAGYVAWMLFLVTLIAFLCWDPIFWGLLLATVSAFLIRRKIWG